jgi:hypothetical protein
MQGDVLVGELSEYGCDQPFFLARFTPGPGWESVRPLFEALAAYRGPDPDGLRFVARPQHVHDAGERRSVGNPQPPRVAVAPFGGGRQQRGHPLPQLVRNKLSTHPDTLPTKIVEHKTRSSTHSETISKPGCIMPYIPEMVYNKAGEYPERAQHIEDAQNVKNLPGKHGTTRYLTRLTDKKKMQENRDVACPKSLPRPAMLSCDEYPFASTWQGGSTGNYSRRFIDEKQNSAGGRALANFYLYNRIIEADRFLVWIK